MHQNIVKHITDQILTHEKNHRLFDIKFKKKYPIWPFYRMYFYVGFMKYKDYLGDHGISARDINKKTAIKFLKLLMDSKLLKCFLPQKNKFMIISSQRYINGEEIYTKDIKKVLKNDYFELSLSNRYNYFYGPVYLDAFKVVFKIISSMTCNLLKAPCAIKNFLRDVGAPKSFMKEFKRYKIEYILWFIFFDIVLRIQKPQKIFIVGAIIFTPLIAAAERLKIEVFELQHGIINNYHLAFHFPGVKRDGFFSNALLLLSDYWKMKADYPLDTKLITIGNNNFCAKNETESKKRNTILFIGQGPLTLKIIDFLRININFFIKNNYIVKYKLHPAEVTGWERYAELKKMHYEGLLEVTSSSVSISQLLDDSEIVFGVSSTAIYEGLDRGCKTFILNLPSSEYFDDLVEKGVVKKIKSEQILSLDDLNFNPNPIGKFFSPTNNEILNYIAYHYRPNVSS